ncbi:MAG: hypothetical protein ACK6BZ_04595 [Candidatus Kapaibacterium sp.]
MQLDVPPLTVYGNNYSTQYAMSPILTVNTEENNRRVWGTKYQGKINGYSDVWYSCSYMAYINDGKWLFTVDGANYEQNPQQFVRIYDVATNKEIKTLPIQGEYYVTKDTKKIFIIKSQQTKSEVLELDVVSGNTTSLINVDYQIVSIHYPQMSDTWIVNGIKNNEYNVYVYKKSSNKEDFRIQETEFYDFVNSFSCDVSEDGETIIGQLDESSPNMKFIGYSIKNRRKIFTYFPTITNFGEYRSSNPKISPDGKSFVIIHGNNLLHFLIDGNKINTIPIQSFTSNSTSLYNLQWLENNKSVIMATLYDIAEVDMVTNIVKDVYITTPIQDMVFLSDKKHVIFTSLNNMTCYNIEDKGVKWKRNFIEPAFNVPFDIYKQSNKMILYRPGYIFVIDAFTGEELEEISVPYDNISMIRFSVSGNKIILGQDKNFEEIIVYDILLKQFSTVKFMNASPSPVHIYFDDVSTNRIVMINEFGSFVSDLEGKLTDVLSFSPSLPRWDNEESKRTSGLGYGYGKIFSDDGKYIIGLRSLFNAKDFELYCANLQDSKNLFTLKADNNAELFYITLADNDKYICAFASDSNIYTWETVTGKFISKQKLAYPLGNNKFGACAYISPYDPTVIGLIADTSRVIVYRSAPITSISQKTIPTMEIESYPQPIHVNDVYFFMKVPMAEIESITAISVLGEIVPLEFVHSDASTYRIMLPSLSRGHYTVQIMTQSGQALVHSILIL